MNEHAENWANLQNSSLMRSGIEIQFRLLRSQFAQQRAFCGRSMQERMRSQQHRGVGQQCQTPSQPQTIEKHLSQSQLILLVRLGWLNPRTDLLQQSPGRQRVER